MHLETAIRESNVFAQITTRVNQLMADDPFDRTGKNDLNLKVEFDAVRKDLEIAKMTVKELETENKQVKAKLQEQNE